MYLHSVERHASHTRSQIPKTNEYLQFTKWAREYGPIYSILVGSQPIIVLSSVEVVKDLFDKRSTIYSSRPELFVTKHIPVGKLRLVVMVSHMPSALNIHGLG